MSPLNIICRNAAFQWQHDLVNGRSHAIRHTYKWQTQIQMNKVRPDAESRYSVYMKRPWQFRLLLRDIIFSCHTFTFRYGAYRAEVTIESRQVEHVMNERVVQETCLENRSKCIF